VLDEIIEYKNQMTTAKVQHTVVFPLQYIHKPVAICIEIVLNFVIGYWGKTFNKSVTIAVIQRKFE
jgi:hypothetical protein